MQTTPKPGCYKQKVFDNRNPIRAKYASISALIVAEYRILRGLIMMKDS
ncbi:MAG: hypothetical protein AAGU11_23370 [Syntrophobacteraceae bacterium]